MCQMSALLTGVFHLAHDVFAIALYVPADGKLTSGNFQLHRYSYPLRERVTAFWL